MPTQKVTWFITSLLCFYFLSIPPDCGFAEEISELAKQVQNPLSDLVRVGFLNNTSLGAGPNDFTFNTFNIQADTTKRFGDWVLLNRLLVPLVYIPASGITQETGSSFGLGDIEYTGFLARDESKRFFRFMAGIGPTIQFNSATEDRLGSGKWSAGPTLGLAGVPDPWVFGVILRQMWSFAGDSERPRVNIFLLQPFINYNFADGWYATSIPPIVANWDSTSRNRWTVPIGGGFGKVVFRGEKRPINLQIQGFYFVEKPDLGPDWAVRLQMQVLFPQ